MSNSRYYQPRSPIGRGDYQKQESPVFGKQFDSGFSDTSLFSMPMQVEADSAIYTGAPPPPKLIVGKELMDAENGDSGINMEEDCEKDCISTFKPQVQTQIPPTVTAMEVDGNELQKSRRSPVFAKKIPRVPKRTLPGSSSVSTVNSGIMRTVSAPHRASSPKSVYSESHSTPHTYCTPFMNKENLQGPYSLPAVRSSSPLTCNMNNFQSLNVVEHHRVPPMVPVDIHQLQDYMDLFLPDGKDGDT